MPRTKNRRKIREVGDYIDEMHDLREEYRELDKQSNALKSKYEELEEELIERLDVSGTDQGRSDTATASIKVTQTASVKDPKRFWDWVAKYKKFHLVENRVSNVSYREEMLHRKTEIPGLRGFTKRTISLRNR